MGAMKRCVLIIFIFCLALTVLSCGNSTNNTTTPSTEKTITIAARSGSHTDVINAVVADFAKDNNCTVNVISFSADELHNEILNNISNEKAIYDLVMIDDPLMPEYIEKNALANLTQLGYSDDEDFVEKSRLLGKDPYPLGATYSLPFSGNVQLIFYNPDLITSPSMLDNWESILSSCTKIKATGKDGYAIRGQSGNPIVSDFLPILWAFGGDLFDENNKLILDSKESREALEFYCKLYQSGNSYEKDELVEAITSGSASVALGWPSWFAASGESSASIAQIPGKRSASSETLPTGEIGNWLLGVTQNSQEQEVALKLAVYLTSEDVQRKALEFGGIPTRKSIFRDPDILNRYPYFQQLYSGTNNSRVRPRTTKWSKIEEVFGAELVKCIEGNQSVNDTIINSHNAIAALLSAQ